MFYAIVATLCFYSGGASHCLGPTLLPQRYYGLDRCDAIRISAVNLAQSEVELLVRAKYPDATEISQVTSCELVT